MQYILSGTPKCPPFPDFLQRQKAGHFIVPAEGKSKYDVRVKVSGSTKWQLQALPLPVATPRVTHLGSPKRCVELYMIWPVLR